MFGYITVSFNTIGDDEKRRYQALYCGLCRRLAVLHGAAGRMTLTYDMTFLSMLLSSLYREEETAGTQRCLIHPLQSHPYILSPATGYAADMSVLLAYYKCLDDWRDDRNPAAWGKSAVLKKKAEAAVTRWQRQCEAVAREIGRLSEMERVGEPNPDLPANCFGALMGELFVREEDQYAPALRRMGSALGRFIYLVDAANDLLEDIKKERYNPLVAQTDTDFTPILTMLMGECTREFEALPLEKDITIMRNILYSGVWIKYKSKGRRD